MCTYTHTQSCTGQGADGGQQEDLPVTAGKDAILEITATTGV